jgi:hypothetical protein
MDSALGLICSYSFVAKRNDEEVYDMHRLVHLATRLWLERSGCASEDRRAVRHINTVFPSDDYENRMIWRQYLPHASRILSTGEKVDDDEEEGSELCLLVGRCLGVDGRISEAVTWLERSYQWRQTHMQETDHKRLLSQHALVIASI